MTLQELFEQLSTNPIWVISYFVIIPFAAFIVNKVSGSKALRSPWAETYRALIFMVAIPALLAIALNVYQFLFERQSILMINVFTQILPIVSFIVTIAVIRKNVSVDSIPGFGKISSLIVMIFGALAIMWVLDRTRISFIAFSYMPFHYVILIFVGILIAIRVGWKRLLK